ncbi:MAG: transposase [Gammaproteobacteria bacterium]|nr:transposase [Gammaproteobacteria bacterium]
MKDESTPESRTPNGRRLRAGRFSEPGRAYLVTMVCRNREPRLATLARGRCVVQVLREMETDASTLCYVVMPDHVHWLLELNSDIGLSRVVQKFKSRSTRALRQRCGETEGVWQRGFHDRAIRRHEDIRAVARYVVANPLRAGLVRRLKDYPLWDAAWL